MKDKTVSEWIEEIDQALDYRKAYAKEDQWSDIEKAFNNDADGYAAIGSNLIYSMGDSLISSLIVPDPEIIIKPERSKYVDKAPIIETIDNLLMRKMDIKRQTNVGLVNGYLFGKVILKIGYDSEFSWSPYYDIGKGNELMGMSLTQFDKNGRRIETPSTTPGMPWVKVVFPHDFLVPWGTLFLEDAPWAAHRVVRHIDHIKADPKYTNKAGLQPSISMETYMESYMHTGTSKQKHRSSNTYQSTTGKAEFVELWEIRDRYSNEIIVICRDHPKFLRRGPDAIQHACGMPFVDASLVTSARSFWSVPPAYYLSQLQATNFDIAMQEEKQRRLRTLKLAYRKGAFSENELSRVLSGDVGAAIEVDSSFPIRDIIAPIPTSTPYDSIAALENIRRDARESIGFSRNQLGEFDASSRRTASESRIVQQGAERRSSKKFMEISDLYLLTMQKVNSLIFEYWHTPREFSVDDKWIYTTGAELKGDYQYDITLSTKRSISRAERKLEALSLMSQFAMMPSVDLQKLQQYVTDASGDATFAEIFAPKSANMSQMNTQPGASVQQNQNTGVQNASI